MSHYLCGIDPGKEGAVAFVSPFDDPLVFDLPYLNGEIDTDALALLLREYKPQAVALETTIAMPKQSVQSCQTSNIAWGRLYERLHVMGYPVHLAKPSVWTKGLPKASSKSDTKRLRIAEAMRRYPSADIGKHDGRADALLLASWLWKERGVNP